MTINVQFDTVANSVSGLRVDGIKILNIDQIPETVTMLGPVLMPQPNGFVSDISPQFQSYGSNGAAKIDLAYTLNYLYLHAPIGSGISTYELYAALLANVIAIFEAIFANDAIDGAIDVQLSSLSDIGTITDPSENQYWGVQFSLRILEHVQ